MPIYRYPVLTWLDASGAATAVLVGDVEHAAARAASATEALRQLHEMLEWRVEHEPWNVDPDLSEAVLFETRVEARPEYVHDDRRTPCPETLQLRVPCVKGIQGGGLPVCVVPHLRVVFNFQDEEGLKSLVTHYVKEALQSQSPAALVARLPPRSCELGELVLRVAGGRERKVPVAEREEYKALFNVAEPLLHDLRRQPKPSAAHGREATSFILSLMLRGDMSSLLLVGEAGCGKSTLLRDAARQAVREEYKSREGESKEDDSEKDLRTYRFWRGTAGRLIAGMRFLGEWEQRCEEFVEQLGAIRGVFCAENLLELLQAGGEGPGSSVGAFLLPYLQQGDLRMIAEATPAEVNACRRLLPGLLDAFKVFRLDSLTDAEAIEILSRLAQTHAASVRLEIKPGVALLTHRLFKRFQPYAAFPGPAAAFIRTLCDPARHKEQKGSERVVDVEQVVRLFARQTGLPEIFLRDDLTLEIETVRHWLATRIVGQPAAVDSAARLLMTIKAGLNDPGRPLGVYLYCGPTGVGKTALSKALSEYCFGTGGQVDRLVRLDMSEYGGWDAARRLLESPQGGSASWIDRVRRQPFCVVLFDEVEKAAPEVFDLLLGLLDEGRLTDRLGRVTDFRSAIILLTSNLGAGARSAMGFAESIGPSYETAAGKFFRPEFFNRLDGVVTFKPLEFEEIKAIARKELAELAEREGLASAGLVLRVSESVATLAAKEGYDPQLGARPLQRAIERLAVSPLSRWKVAHPDVRDVTLLMDLDEQEKVTVVVDLAK